MKFLAYASLFALLAALSLTLWQSAEYPAPIENAVASLPKSPPVVYEDTQHLATLTTLDESQHEKSQAIPSRQGIALILDDVGYDLEALGRILKLPYPMAISIIPNAPHAVRAAEMAHAAGHVVMLHLPMEPSNPRYSYRMDDAFLRAGMSRDDVRRILLADLTRIPYVEGINNHMGSRLTALEKPMRWVMDICRERGLFFVDSRTSKDSVAARIAREDGLRWGSRRVFLDNSLQEKDLEKSWHAAKRKLAGHRPVIVIAHPHDATLDFFEKHINAGDIKRIRPLKQILFDGDAAHVAANTSPHIRTLGGMHAENNTR